MLLNVFWIEEENKWIYTDSNELANSVRDFYIDKGGYVEYSMVVRDGIIVATDYSESIVGTKFKGELLTEVPTTC